MKIFFKSRSAMRSFSAGKATDNGKASGKRWSRDFEPVNTKRLPTFNLVTVADPITGRKKDVPVMTRKSRSIKAVA